MFDGSFSTKVPELEDEGCSDDLLCRRHLWGSGVSGADAELVVDGVFWVFFWRRQSWMTNVLENQARRRPGTLYIEPSG